MTYDISNMWGQCICFYYPKILFLFANLGVGQQIGSAIQIGHFNNFPGMSINIYINIPTSNSSIIGFFELSNDGKIYYGSQYDGVTPANGWIRTNLIGPAFWL